jgi:hypothetical protein
MRRALALVLLAGACAPKEDYTPQIAVDPGAAQRICFLCVQTMHASGTAQRCPQDIAEVCAEVIQSDVVRPKVILVDAVDEDAGTPD